MPTLPRPTGPNPRIAAALRIELGGNFRLVISRSVGRGPPYRAQALQRRTDIGAAVRARRCAIHIVSATQAHNPAERRLNTLALRIANLAFRIDTPARSHAASAAASNTRLRPSAPTNRCPLTA